MPKQRSIQICCASLCLREIQPHEKAVEIRCFARTQGMGKRRTSKSEQLFLCPQCANRTVIGKEPTKAEPFNHAIFKIVLDLVGADPDVAEAAWEQTRQRREEVLYTSLQLAAPAEVIPPAKRLKEAS